MANASAQVAADAVIDSALDLFERERKAGKQPMIADYLGVVGMEMRLRLLEELIYVESEYRGAGEPASVLEEYLAEFPELAKDSERRARLEGEMDRIRARSGSLPTAPPIKPSPAATGDMRMPATVAMPDAQHNGPAPRATGGGGISAPPKIGKYIVLQILSSGGQADVFRVAHPKLGGEFILKRFRPKEGVDPAEMLDEGRKLQTLSDCPAIARVFDADIVDGLAMIVVEYINGQTLAQYARQYKLSALRWAAMVAQIGRGLGAAHRIGVSHLDVKPENLLVDSAGNPKIIDFGIARARGAWHDQTDAEGHISGTPAYMPPEQAQGRCQELGPRSDVFSLGGVLFFLLTGRPLYDANTQSAYLAKAAQWQWDEESLRLAPAPGRCKEICRKAISKNPADRYADGDAFAAALEKWINGKRIKKWLAFIVVGLIFISGIALAWHQFFPNDPMLDFPLHVEVASNRGDFRDVGDVDSAHPGDRINVHATIPPGRYATLFIVDRTSATAVCRVTPDGPRRLDYEGDHLSTGSAPGTELCVVVSSRHAIDTLSPTWLSQRRMPPLPAGTIMLLKLFDVTPQSNSRSPESQSDYVEVQHQLEDLSESLRGQADGIEAIAFRVDR